MEVAVSTLRAELKTWLERARAGEDVIVTERGVPVARLVSVEGADLVGGLIRDGILSPPTEPRVALGRAAEYPEADADHRDVERGVAGLVRRLRR